jgi:thioredoxin reductase (NADPH)
MDAKGFILTGAQAGSEAFFGTSLKGIYAVGDVRSGSVKRVASAVGEGSVVISEIHQYLAQCHASKETSPFSGTPSVHLDPPAYVAIA